MRANETRLFEQCYPIILPQCGERFLAPFIWRYNVAFPSAGATLYCHAKAAQNWSSMNKRQGCRLSLTVSVCRVLTDIRLSHHPCMQFPPLNTPLEKTVSDLFLPRSVGTESSFGSCFSISFLFCLFFGLLLIFAFRLPVSFLLLFFFPLCWAGLLSEELPCECTV